MSTRTAITGSGVWTPEHVVTNEDLCEAFNEFVRRDNQRNAAAIEAGDAQALQESSPEFIFKASGIKQRYVQDRVGVLDPDRMAPNLPDRPDDEMSYQCEYAVRAAEKALAAAGRHGEEVDLVVCAASNLQRAYPAIGIEVQSAIGARGYGLDMQVGCSSATYGLKAASESVATGAAKVALVVVPELTSGHMNYRDRDSHFIFGDASVAAVVERADEVASEHAFEIVSSQAMSRFSSNIRNNGGYLNHCDPEHQFDADKLFYQQGRRVFKDIVPLASKFITAHLAAHGLEPSDASRFWLHQANQNMNVLVTKRLLGREATPEEAPLILDEYANTASAGSLIAFSHYSADLPSGAYGVMCSFGAGYSLGSLLLRKL